MSSNNQQNSNNVIAGAITFPDRSDDNVRPVPVQPRQPRNLQGLLKFAMEATKAEDAPGNSDLGPMDEERRKFLEEALKSLTVNVATVLQEAIKVLTNAEKIKSIKRAGPVPSDVKSAFDNLLEYIDDIDVANDFYKMGGFPMIPICYGCDNEEVRSSTSSVLAELCQNNPFWQKHALDCGLLPVLISLVQMERGQALSKCLGALSCICRDFEPGCLEFLSLGGCDVLAVLVKEEDKSVRTKALFFIRHLCQHFNQAKEEFIQHNLVGTIAELLKNGRDETTEHLLSTLSAMTEGLNPDVLRQCRDPSVGLKGTLEMLLQHPDLQGDRFEEEKDYCKDLLREVFANCTEVEILNDEIADR